MSRTIDIGDADNPFSLDINVTHGRYDEDLEAVNERVTPRIQSALRSANIIQAALSEGPIDGECVEDYLHWDHLESSLKAIADEEGLIAIEINGREVV